ncbi:MAG: hypothetical protein PVH55_03000 [Desulfobacterales bacterium]|jgi:uncharacterized alpha/beta hydrolase family protein
MKNYMILVLLFFTIVCFADHALAQEEHWNQIDTDDLTQVQIKDKYYNLLKHNKAELDKTVKALQTPSQRPPEAVFEEKYLKGWKKKIKANHRKP